MGEPTGFEEVHELFVSILQDEEVLFHAEHGVSLAVAIQDGRVLRAGLIGASRPLTAWPDVSRTTCSKRFHFEPSLEEEARLAKFLSSWYKAICSMSTAQRPILRTVK